MRPLEKTEEVVNMLQANPSGEDLAIVFLGVTECVNGKELNGNVSDKLVARRT